MPKKHSGISKAANGTWMIHTRIATPNGDKITLTKRGFDTEGAAFEALEQTKRKRYQEYIDSKRPLMWAKAAKEYWEHYSTQVKETTAKNAFASYRKYIIDPFQALTIVQMMHKNNFRILKETIEKMKVKDGDHKNRIIRYMRRCIDYHYQRGNITPEEFKMSNIELEPVYSGDEVKSERPIWSIQEFKMFLDTFSHDDKYYVLFELLGHTGCRIGELRGLQVKHFNREAKDLYICQQVVSKLGENIWKIVTPKTKASIRHISLSDRISYLLTSYINDMSYRDDDFIFFGKNPISETSIRRVLANHIKMAGVTSISPHCLRHSNTTWLLSDPGLSLSNISIISKRLGHGSKKITLDIYFHIQNISTSETILNALI